jgi:hypothetical protein
MNFECFYESLADDIYGPSIDGCECPVCGDILPYGDLDWRCATIIHDTSVCSDECQEEWIKQNWEILEQQKRESVCDD